MMLMFPHAVIMTSLTSHAGHESGRSTPGVRPDQAHNHQVRSAVRSTSRIRVDLHVAKIVQREPYQF